MDEIYARLRQVFHEVFDDETLIVTPELAASDVAEWDSLTHVRLMVAVGKSFNIKLPAAQTAVLQNVGQLAELIRSKTSGR
jgi:acyl carrier protein